ncbi:sensor histidine kinase [Arthrobacter crystallopoietes]|uniref:histidine kinase n=1 Tax=Crystallibacter crystallopoietes TaxID=37928 RepID=A0A1H1FIQ8_9MICC|nr:PAS domain-containing sensor histidine kinase [Arthrobacter crystallopoietes]AUI49465.1 ATPase [Arthrobacter crystallopoietes]SDR00366.1 Two-component sensor histidine kinase, contains HisKA and HATPase domains [Arthrobacter crystallopoietes]
MAIFTDPIKDYADFGPGDAEWLHLLVGDWQLIADLAFADLALWFPTPDGGYVALAHVRPSTTHTVFHSDFVGERIRADLKPLVDAARESQVIERSGETNWTTEMAMRVEAVPMVRNGRTLAIVTSHMDLSSSRMPSRLELTYRQCAYDLLHMCTLGLWPDFASPTGSRRGAPRVGDGLIRMDAEGVVEYASPNGVSAFRRLGDVESLEGRSLAEITTGLLKDRRMVDETLPLVVTGRMPWRTEIESRGVTLTLRAIPLRNEQERFGALVLCRDVSELRRREMELVSKDATIREIHHRVKNNLQTVAALLRMQSRRMVSEEGKQGLEQAMRRVSTIALVHETLSQGLAQNVDFDELIGRQFRLSAEVASPTQTVSTERSGDFGELPSEFATPLALVINELVTNAVEHGLDGRTGTVWLTADREPSEAETELLKVTIADDGVGLPEEAKSDGLGLQIVRTLVTSELGGTIEWSPREGGGTCVNIELILDPTIPR